MKKALKIVFNVIAWVVLIFALLITILVFSSDKNNGTASLLGYVPLTVESDSMKPTFKKGDLIISKEIDDINSLKKGDVITFWTLIDGKKVKNTHRIAEVLNDNGSVGFITRGDANNVDDTYTVYAGDIRYNRSVEWCKNRRFRQGNGFSQNKNGIFHLHTFADSTVFPL